MTKTWKIGLVASLAIISAITAPRTVCAQAPEYLVSSGFASVDMDIEDGPYQGDYSGFGPATLYLTYYPNYPYAGGSDVMSIVVAVPTPFLDETGLFVEMPAAPFTATSGMDSTFVGGPDGFAANFFISPDYSIVADITENSEFVGGSYFGTTQILFQGTTLPEPATIVQMATAAVVIGFASWQARRRKSPAKDQGQT